MGCSVKGAAQIDHACINFIRQNLSEDCLVLALMAVACAASLTGSIEYNKWKIA